MDYGQQDQGLCTGDHLAERIMAAEYNLAVQRGDAPEATGIVAQMLGMWLNNRAGG